MKDSVGKEIGESNVWGSFLVYGKGNDRRLKIEYMGGDREHDIFYMDREDGTVDRKIHDWEYLQDTLREWYRDMRPTLLEMYKAQKIEPLPVWKGTACL